jgi:hypothetical protein
MLDLRSQVSEGTMSKPTTTQMLQKAAEKRVSLSEQIASAQVELAAVDGQLLNLCTRHYSKLAGSGKLVGVDVGSHEILIRARNETEAPIIVAVKVKG